MSALTSDITQDAIVSVRDLQVQFQTSDRRATVKAVDGVNFDVRRGETFGIIGESGSGKTTIGRALVFLLKPSAGAILEDNTILTAIPAEWTQPPSISSYLNRYGVSVFDPQWAGRTFGEMASRNRRGAWRDEFTAQKLIEYWWAGMRPPE